MYEHATLRMAATKKRVWKSVPVSLDVDPYLPNPFDSSNGGSRCERSLATPRDLWHPFLHRVKSLPNGSIDVVFQLGAREWIHTLGEWGKFECLAPAECSNVP